MEGGAQALATGLDSQQDLRNGFHIYIIVLYMVVVVMKYKKSQRRINRADFIESFRRHPK